MSSVVPAALSLHSDRSVLTKADSSCYAVHEESNHRRCPKYSYRLRQYLGYEVIQITSYDTVTMNQ